MRILFTYMGGSGHLAPLAPVARAAADAGHQVMFVAHPSTAAQVEGAAFDYVLAPNTSRAPERLAIWEQAEAIETIAEREDFLLRESFARFGAQVQADTVLKMCREWQPDLIVRDEADFGSAIAAEKRGIPLAVVLVIASGSLMRHSVIGEPLHALREKHGLPPDPQLTMLSRDLVISPFPASFRDPDFPLPHNSINIRPFGLEPRPNDTLPEWFGRMPEQPTIYFSLGTEFNTERQDIFAPVIEGLRDLPVNLIVTVGRDVDPAALGEQPANVHIEQYVPQALLLPHVDLVVTHGGSGTLMGAFSHGLPVVVIPLGADQPQNAGRCAELGTGRVVIDTDVTPDSVRDAATDAMSNPSYRASAERLRVEIAGLPGPEHAVPRLEALAGTR